MGDNLAVDLDYFVAKKKAVVPIPAQFIRALIYETGMRPNEFLRLGKSNFNRSFSTVAFTSSKQHADLEYMLTASTSIICAQFFFLYSSVMSWQTSVWSLLRDYDYYWHNTIKLDDAHNALYYLRYLCCARLMDEGLDLDEIADYFGHTDFTSTLVYMQKGQKLLDSR